MSTNQTKHVQLPRQFNQADLEAAQAVAVDKVMEGSYIETTSGGFWRYPAAAERQFFNNPDDFLAYVGEQAIKGIKVFPYDSPVMTAGYYAITYYKPQNELDVLITEAKEKAKIDYLASIEAFNASMVELLTSQLVEQELQKERKKEEQRLQAITEKAAAVAQAHIASQLKEGK